MGEFGGRTCSSNNAGIGTIVPAEETRSADWTQDLAVT